MNRAEIDEYRRSVESEYSITGKEIDTSLSYICTALIGFFSTADGKVLPDEKHTCVFLYFIGLLFLAASLAILLIKKHFNSNNGLEMLDHISKMEENNKAMEDRLYEIWKAGYKCSKKILTFSSVTFILGLVISVIYLYINL